MLGIIYKFTIVAKVKYNGHKPYYIGQHWEKKNLSYFLSSRGYIGSGSIWLNLIRKIKQSNPDNWRFFLRREVLYSSEHITQGGLDALEKYFIEKYKSFDYLELGGCNVIDGTANHFAAGSPAKLPRVREKMHLKMQERLRNGWRPKGVAISAERAKRQSIIMKEYYRTHVSPNKGKHIPKEQHPMYGRKHSLKSRKLMSQHHADISGDKNPMRTHSIDFSGNKNPFFGKHHTDEVKEKQSAIMKEYYRTHRNPQKGKKLGHQSKERKEQQSKAIKGMRWITNGTIDRRTKDLTNIPKGWRLGRSNYKMK